MDGQTTVNTRGPDVMVSYSSHDRTQVMQFVQRLRAAGVAAWIDQGGIDGAQKWGEEIVNAIDACKTVILMISQTSMKSENIAREVMLAWENGKHFLPLCLEDAPIPKSMQYQLAGIQKIMLFQGDPEAKFVAVLRALVRLGVQVSPYYIALISADLGEREQAFEWLSKAVEQRSAGLARLKTEPRFGSLRGDPRFAELARQVEAMPLDAEQVVPETPAFVPRTVAAVPRVPAGGPAPLWKKLLWPEIVDDRGARQAAAQGVWATAFLLTMALLVSLFTSNPGGASLLGAGWNGFLVMAVIFAPIAFGVQKMGRPAAIIGLILCASGALQNLQLVQTSGQMVDTYRRAAQAAVQNPYYQGQYQNPYLDQAYSQYYHSWFALAVSLICVGAFTNATRGTFAYRRLVMAHQAEDKQDAIVRGDLAALKSGIAGSRSKKQTAAPRPATARETYAPAQPTLRADAAVLTPRAAAPVSAPTAETSPAPPAAVVVEAAPVRLGFAAMIGVSGGLIYWPRVLVFLAANVAGGLAFVAGLSLTSSLPVSAVYWLLFICLACVFTAATVAGFRFIPNAWAGSAAAAIAATAVSLPFYSMLPSFAWEDLVYREQFQQFILLPAVSFFIFLVAMIWIVPRLQPLLLALWLGAMGTEIAASLVSNLLHILGAGNPPDAVLGAASVISAVLRSLVFAAALWGGLEYVKRKREAN
jgi:hypothetical protein